MAMLARSVFRQEASVTKVGNGGLELFPISHYVSPQVLAGIVHVLAARPGKRFQRMIGS
jgi:hypothetical protein